MYPVYPIKKREESEWEFDVEEILQAAHDVWGFFNFEDFVVKKMGELDVHIEKVVGPRWSIEFGKAGQVDFFGCQRKGCGKEAFANTKPICTTWTKLPTPHADEGFRQWFGVQQHQCCEMPRV